MLDAVLLISTLQARLPVGYRFYEIESQQSVLLEQATVCFLKITKTLTLEGYHPPASRLS